MTSSIDELSAIDPQPTTITLAGGTQVFIERLRARQFFRLLKIVTHGAMPILNDMRMLPDPRGNAEQFTYSLVSMILLSIPDAEDETISFIGSMCTPVGLRAGGRRATKEDTEYNANLWERLNNELVNPELDDILSIVEAIVRVESADIQALGKRLMAMFALAQKTGQIPDQKSAGQSPPETLTSSEASVEPSTSSPPSTAGPTNTSET
jgi:hypothetical protein